MIYVLLLLIRSEKMIKRKWRLSHFSIVFHFLILRNWAMRRKKMGTHHSTECPKAAFPPHTCRPQWSEHPRRAFLVSPTRCLPWCQVAGLYLHMHRGQGQTIIG